MSDTPRTDEEEKLCGRMDQTGDDYLIPSDFARKLERENAALRKALTFYGDCQTYGLNGGSMKRLVTDAGALARHALRKEAQP